ncbi:MAG: hypothetical protein WA154_15310 [Moraxellaceae bacterium]
MTIFLANILAFPTIIFSILLSVAVLYWLISLTGLLGADHAGSDHSIDSAHDGLDFGGLMSTLGLKGVPLPLLLTLVLLWAWLTTYSIQVLFAPWLTGILGIVVGCVLIPVALLLGLVLSALLVRPFHAMLTETEQPTQTRILGCVCSVLSPTVDKEQGRAEAHLDGAHLILQVRSSTPLLRGSRAVFVEYIADKNLYWVVPEAEFLAGSIRQISMEDR